MKGLAWLTTHFDEWQGKASIATETLDGLRICEERAKGCVDRVVNALASGEGRQ